MPDIVRESNREYVDGLASLAGYTRSGLAKKAGLYHTTVTRLFDADKITSANSQRTIDKLTTAAINAVTEAVSKGGDPDDILRRNAGFLDWADRHSFPLRARLHRALKKPEVYGYSDKGLRMVEVIGHVQAGEYQAALKWDRDRRYTVPASDDRAWDDLAQEGLEVRGTSMDRKFPAGTVLVVVNLFELGRDPRPGEYVIVRRQGLEGVESTCKRYEVDSEGRHWLWPESHDPQFQQPIQLIEGADEVQIVGLVIAAHTRLARR